MGSGYLQDSVFWSSCILPLMGKDSNIAALYDAEPEAEILAMEVCRKMNHRHFIRNICRSTHIV